MRLGEYIKSYRDDHDMTMESFASKSGLTKGYVSMLEKGTNPRSGKEIVPSLETIRKVADVTVVCWTLFPELPPVFDRIGGR